MKADQTTTHSRGTAQAGGARRSAAARRKGDGHADSMLADGGDTGQTSQTGDPRDQAVREAAYAFYEARGCVDGFALDDWLKAEAQFSTTH
jgi:hypothetical protein